MVRLVELRYFLGFTAEETAELMQVSRATINRQLQFIKSWLYLRICPEALPRIRQGCDPFCRQFTQFSQLVEIGARLKMGHSNGTISKRVHAIFYEVLAAPAELRANLLTALCGENRPLVEGCAFIVGRPLGRRAADGFPQGRSRLLARRSAAAQAQSGLMRLIVCWGAAEWAPSIWRTAPTDSSSSRSPSN